jgi:MFS family permease
LDVDVMVINPFLMLCAAGLLGIFSSTISKSPVLPLFATHLGAGPAGVGAVAAVSAFTGVLLSLPAGLLSDRLGRRRLLLGAGAVFASAPFAYLLVADTWQLMLVRLYHGLATAVFMPVAMALVADLHVSQRGEKIGWFSTATLLGRFMAPLAGGALLSGLGLEGGWGFKAVYLLCGLTGLGMLGLCLAIPAAAEGPRPAASWGETWAGFRGIVGQRAIVVTALVEAAVLFAYGVFEVFLPLQAVARGREPWEAGLFLSSQVLTLALSKPLLGRFSDRHGRPPQILAGCLLAGLTVGALAWAEGFAALLGLSIVFGLGLSVVTSASAAYIADLSQAGGRGSAMGLLGSVMDLGHSSGPLLGGLAAAWLGAAWSFWLAAVVLALAALGFWALVMAGGGRRARV